MTKHERKERKQIPSTLHQKKSNKREKKKNWTPSKLKLFVKKMKRQPIE
jgi:hypothetical protein